MCHILISRFLRIYKMNMPISLLTLRTYYEDTDADGSEYYADHLKFFERGRAGYLRKIKVSQSDLLKKKLRLL